MGLLGFHPPYLGNNQIVVIQQRKLGILFKYTNLELQISIFFSMDRNGDFQPFPMQIFGENHPIETIINRCFRSQVCTIQSSLIPVSHIFKPNVFLMIH